MNHHMFWMAIIAVVTIAFNAAYCSSQQARSQVSDKPVCIEAHLGINKTESIVLCGTVANLKEIE